MTQRIGILGGGQLGRMLALAGYPLGLRFRIFDPSPDAPAGRVADHICGGYDDCALLEQFADGLDVVTYEFENVPVAAVRFLAQRCPIYPPSQALAVAQDRLAEKLFFRSLNIPTSTFVPIDSYDDLERALETFGLPAVLKTRCSGYDGKGQCVLHDAEESDKAWNRLKGVPLILESFVPFERELSILSVRDRAGNILFYPIVENVHRDGILYHSLAPAPNLSDKNIHEARGFAKRVLEMLNYVGVLAIELFEFHGTLLANEMAPRVHNSGHWTIEGAKTSQFANHIRAILGLPLGSPDALGYSAMVNLIGHIPERAKMLARSNTHLHLYDKEPRPGRKLGHITFQTNDLEKAQGFLANRAVYVDH